jgi:hypothetical protein
MTPSGIDPTIFWFVAQCLNHCATVCPEVNQHNLLFLGLYPLSKIFKMHEVSEDGCFHFLAKKHLTWWTN